MFSRQKRDPNWFQTTLSSVRDAIVATDAQGKVLLMNPAAERLTGWGLPDVEGKPLSQVLVLKTAAARAVVDRLVDDFGRCGDVGKFEQAVLQRRDGSEVYFDDSSAPICSDEGTLLGFVVVFRDISTRRCQEEKNARLLEDLKRANGAKDEFLAMLGHELRNPLAPLVTGVELLKLKAGDRLARECNMVERQLHHMLRLVDDLLDASRIGRGKVEVSRQPIDLTYVVDHALEMLSPMLQERRQATDVSMAPYLWVLGDSDRLAQVVANLLHNAAKYSEKGSRITVSGAREDHQVVLTVRDHGIGIERARLAAIFEPFVQTAQALDRAQGGLGLGLAIARGLVELHGGTIAVHSDGPGTGSTFTVRLPALDSAEAPASAERLRVLIVDDNADAAEALADALVLLGYEAVTAPDGPQALSRVTTTRPSIALLDIGLPGMDGYDLARRLRGASDRNSLKLVALTGYGLAVDRERALAAGFDEHLVKPASLDVIQRVIERLAPTPAA